MTLNDQIEKAEKEFSDRYGSFEFSSVINKFTHDALSAFLASKLREIATATLAACEVEREDNICTCDRRVCHCGKFPTGKETNAYNAAISEQKKKSEEWLNQKT